MKFRFTAALLLAALSITVFSGCTTAAAAPAPMEAPVLTVTEAPGVPLAPMPKTEAPTAAPAPATEATAPTQAPAEKPERLTKDEAISIALKDAGLSKDQVTRLKAEFDYDDGRPEYDVDFHSGGYEYDYEIHAESGKILSRDKERED